MLCIRAEGDCHKEIYIVERSNKAEIRLEEQSEKAESCQENLRNEIQLKGQQNFKGAKSEAASWPEHIQNMQIFP